MIITTQTVSYPDSFFSPWVSRVVRPLQKEGNDMSPLNPVQERAYSEVVKNFSFTTDSTKIEVTPCASYVHSPLFLHDYATGVVASAASALEHLGQVRGLPSQSIRLDRRLVGLHY